MTTIEKYNKAFMETFGLNEKQLGDALVYQSIPAWDSVGHMSLIGALEDSFGIALEADDIVNLSSYKIGQKLLAKYGLQL